MKHLPGFQTMRRVGISSVFLAIVAVVLAGCNKNPLEVTVSRCPAAAVVSKTGTVTRFAGDERRDVDVTFNAVMTGVRVECQQGSDVDSTISFHVLASKGPAAESDTVTLPYYVVVLQDNHRIISKKVFEATIRFRPGQRRVGVREVVRQYLPDIDRVRRYNYEVLLGFQLTPEEVAFNALRAAPEAS